MEVTSNTYYRGVAEVDRSLVSCLAHERDKTASISDRAKIGASENDEDSCRPNPCAVVNWRAHTPRTGLEPSTVCSDRYTFLIW